MKDTDEVELYCHSSQREKRSLDIEEMFAKRFESEIDKLADGLHKKGTVKKYAKVVERVGRINQKYSRAAQYYEVTVTPDETNVMAIAIKWKRKKKIEDTLPGVYCLRTNSEPMERDYAMEYLYDAYRFGGRFP